MSRIAKGGENLRNLEIIFIFIFLKKVLKSLLFFNCFYFFGGGGGWNCFERGRKYKFFMYITQGELVCIWMNFCCIAVVCIWMNFCCISAISITFTGLCDLGCLYYLLCGSHVLLLILILSLCYSIVIYTCLFVSISTHALI